MKHSHVLILRSILAAALTLLALEARVSAQDIRVMDVGRAHLSPTEDTDTPGKVRWSMKRVGTRTVNMGCGIETEFTNSTGELRFRLIDLGGLSGDPACRLSLRFESLHNSYTFDGASIEVAYCGSECTADVIATSGRGSTTLDVVVRGRMKGVVMGFPKRKSIFRVYAKLRGPVGLSPFTP